MTIGKLTLDEVTIGSMPINEVAIDEKMHTK
jgi:hypothetical protein